MKISEEFKRRLVLVAAAAVVLFVLFLIVSSFSSLKKGFHNELAKRLETEEAMQKIENERANFLNKIDNLNRELVMAKEKMANMADELVREQEAHKLLAAECDKAKSGK